MQSRRSAAAFDQLGVSEHVYPVDDARHQIDHVKLLVADGEAAIGGMNWGKSSERNHDYVLETRVALEVDRFVRIFDQDRTFAGGDPEPLPSTADAVAQTNPGGEIRAMLVGARFRGERRALVEIYTSPTPT